ncbi:MAG TPA: ABC transporter permease [candidate division Zixibacteria bacterium]|nr:ABC transporter permease [candidate division Zixibacteria bacterium]
MASTALTRDAARPPGRARWWLLVPAGLWYLALLVAPLAILLIFSFGIRAPNGGYLPALTLEQYEALTTRLTPFQNTIVLGLAGTFLCLLVAYPLAYYLATRAGSRKMVLLALIVIPLWTSFLIRTYAWMFLLGNSGIPRVLSELNIIEDLQLLNTPFAVLLGIVYNYLPLMALPIYVSLERLDKSLVEASKDLGAGRFATFCQVTLPLSAPGILSGCLLVFIPVMGEYLIPVLLGGGKTYFLGNALADLFLQSRNWPFGSAIGTAFVVIMLIVVVIYNRIGARLARSRPDAQLL